MKIAIVAVRCPEKPHHDRGREEQRGREGNAPEGDSAFVAFSIFHYGAS